MRAPTGPASRCRARSPASSGGGALQGIGEKFSPDLHTGTGNLTVPLALPPGRGGFEPAAERWGLSGQLGGLNLPHHRVASGPSEGPAAR